MQVCVSLYFEFCTACPAPFVYTIPDCYEQDRWQKLCAVKGGFGWGCSWPQNTTACTMCTHQSMHHVHTPRAHTTACTMCIHHVHTPQHAPCAHISICMLQLGSQTYIKWKWRKVVFSKLWAPHQAAMFASCADLHTRTSNSSFTISLCAWYLLLNSLKPTVMSKTPIKNVWLVASFWQDNQSNIDNAVQKTAKIAVEQRVRSCAVSFWISD